MVTVDYLDPLELCPKDPAEGERVKIAVHALMLNPNDNKARFRLMQYGFGDKVLDYAGENAVFPDLRDRNGVLFELANQAVMAICFCKLARGIYKYDRYQYSLSSFIWHNYFYAKNTVKGYAKTALKACMALDPDKTQEAKEYDKYLKSDSRDTLPYHQSTLWAEAFSSLLSRHTSDFYSPVSNVRTIQVGGETVVVTSPDGPRHRIRMGHHEEHLSHLALDMSFEECERALAALQAHQAPLYCDSTSAKRRPALPAAEFESFKRFYLKASKDNTFTQAVNSEVNLEIGRLYLCEEMSLAGILDTLGPDYPRQVAGKKDGPSDAKIPEPLTPVKVRSRIYQNIVPALDEFMKERKSCISEEKSSSPSEAKEGSSACTI